MKTDRIWAKRAARSGMGWMTKPLNLRRKVWLHPSIPDLAEWPD